MGQSGVSTFDLLGDLPSSQRTLMRLFLRRVQMSAAELDAAVANLPPEKHLTDDEFRATLKILLTQGWIRRFERDGQVIYVVQQLSASH